MFDGTYLIVVNSSDQSVTYVNVSTNATATHSLETVSGMFPTGIGWSVPEDRPFYLYGDYSTGDSHLQIRGASGASYTGCSTAGGIQRLTSDGVHLWVLPSAFGSLCGFLLPSQKTEVALNYPMSSTAMAIVPDSNGLAYVLVDDGAGGCSVLLYDTSDPSTVLDYAWLSAPPSDGVITRDDTLWVLSASTGFVTKVPIRANWAQPITWTGWVSNPTAMATDGTDVYIVSGTDNTITRIKPNGDSKTITFDSNRSYRPADIIFDGDYFWVINGGSSNVVKVAPF